MSIFSQIIFVYSYRKLKKAVKLIDIKKIEKHFLKIQPSFEAEILTANDSVKSAAYFTMGISSAYLQKSPEIQDYFLKALISFENIKIKNDSVLFVINSYLAKEYYLQENFKEAIKYFLQGLSSFDRIEIPTPENIHLLLRLLVNSYFYENQHQSAEPFARRELALLESLNLPTLSCVNDLGIICFEIENYDEAEVLLTKSLAIREALHLKDNSALQEAKEKAIADNMDVNQQMIETTLEYLIDLHYFCSENNKAIEYYQKLKYYNPNTEFELSDDCFVDIDDSDLSFLDSQHDQKIIPIQSLKPSIGRNILCLCGSGKKFKNCCIK